MNYIEEYIKLAKHHIENKDLFIIKSYIFSDDEDNLMPKKYKKINVNNNIDYFESDSLNNFDRSICRHRYTYICEILDFYDPDKLYEPYCDFFLKIKIIKVIDNPMNIPEIIENNILILTQSGLVFDYPPNILTSYSIFYKNINKDNIIKCKDSEVESASLKDKKKYFYMEMKPYTSELGTITITPNEGL